MAGGLSFWTHRKAADLQTTGLRYKVVFS